MKRILLIAAACFALAAPASAQEPPPAPDRPLPDAAQEARAQALFDDIRCVVCQHEAIADSPAGIAGDMRGLVRDQIAAGASDQQIRQDLVRRYGDFVLFKPPVRGGTWLLWFGPLILMLAAGALILWRGKRRPVEVAALTPEEDARLSDILKQEPVRRDPDAKPSND
ncbi:cytochrome c-type biogenesis protein [uncultured Brevundimonas sp.]|uniref:cytochrome c-type biogenesis protein n=1 Tax=uncultured Brevundimonas sp. TaxID=213418 RepID=UPI0025E5BF61|nr:cytochrome c-type biogenesis protein [uncultured Brevundimonas sp.]